MELLHDVEYPDYGSLRYVVRLRKAETVSWDFGLVVAGRLCLFALKDAVSIDPDRPVLAKRLEDQEASSLDKEQIRNVQGGKSEATLVWDYGTYRCLLNEPQAQDQLSSGRLDLTLHGVRLHGRFCVEGRGEDWRLAKLWDEHASMTVPCWDQRSVVSGRSLDESTSTPKRFVLWLEWRMFYADDAQETPQIVVRDRAVLDANSAALAKGVEVGMDIPRVRNLSPDCEKKEWVLTDYVEKQRLWLDVCTRFSDQIEPLDAHIAAVDLTTHPRPGEIAQRLIQSLKTALPCQLTNGAGPSKWVASLAARQGELNHAFRDSASFLAPLSIEDLLPVPRAHRDRLSALGYRIVGDVARVPLDTLRGQFDKDAPLLMFAARGAVPDPVKPMYPPGALQESLYFDGPVSDTIVMDQALMKLAAQVAERLEGRQSPIVELSLDDEDGRSESHKRRFTRPVHNLATVAAALRALWSRRESTAPPVTVRVCLYETEPRRDTQSSFFTAKADVGAGGAVQSLNGVFGHNVVKVAAEIEVARRQLVLREWRNATGWN